VISISDMQPEYSAEINVTAPWGAIPTKPFQVLWLLYEENVFELSAKEEGFSVNIDENFLCFYVDWNVGSLQKILQSDLKYTNLQLAEK
jgi:hypothetical protein